MREEIEKEPLAKIRNLNDAIDTVLKKIQYLQQDKEKIESKLLHVSRKTKIAELFSGKYLVAITGLQGQGKSTLLKAFLELDGDYIPTNSGKGEVEPIIIKLQDDISSPKCYKYGFQNKTTRQEFCYEEISKDELKELAENGIKDNDAFYLEIRVPAKDRNMANKEFLLLPGLEPYNQEEDWQKNIEYYLEWCMSAIVVTRMEKLADSDTISF